jgi:hypothetical protein
MSWKIKIEDTYLTRLTIDDRHISDETIDLIIADIYRRLLDESAHQTKPTIQKG